MRFCFSGNTQLLKGGSTSFFICFKRKIKIPHPPTRKQNRPGRMHIKNKQQGKRNRPEEEYMAKKYYRSDQDGPHRRAFERNKKRIQATQDVCGICGKPVDKSLKFPHPMSQCIDHIIPINKGGHPSDIDNLQLAHLTCNRLKSDNININDSNEGGTHREGQDQTVTNRDLPKIIDWEKYKR